MRGGVVLSRISALTVRLWKQVYTSVACQSLITHCTTVCACAAVPSTVFGAAAFYEPGSGQTVYTLCSFSLITSSKSRERPDRV
ncbi:hypothetical protein GGS26DRAFT_455562 [Hypomontagnella submonticulosa]|nr:hypothetical protein GGS26DRAFT_455562 [Hypomontagnella submonticulosa]